MLMVVFGAGASYDSVPSRDFDARLYASQLRPPLAVELFSKRGPFDAALSQYPPCVPMLGELRGAVARQQSVEEALQGFAEEAEHGNDLTVRQLMAMRFYLQRIIRECGGEWQTLSSGVTNYATLLNIIERLRRATDEEVLLVTFNYDTLVERALTITIGQTFVSTDDYMLGEPQRYRLAKLHGSVDWKRLVRVAASTPVAELINNSAGLDITDDVRMDGEVTDKAGIPALAVPTRSKSLFECPGTHESRLKHLLPDVDRVLVVGWRAQEQSFLDLLASRSWENTSVMVVSEDRARAEPTVDALRVPLPDASLVASDASGFTGLVTDTDLVRRAWEGMS